MLITRLSLSTLCILISTNVDASAGHGMFANCHNTPETHTCLNGGSCRKGYRGWRCKCTIDFTGVRCSAPNPCYPYPCVKGHAMTCRTKGKEDSGYYFYCHCRAKYTGKRCESELGPGEITNPNSRHHVFNCHDTPDTYQCLNGGSCQRVGSETSGTRRWRCKCLRTHTGKCCEHKNPCQSSPCITGQSRACVAKYAPGSGGMGYYCHCYPGFTGPRCESILDSNATRKRKLQLEAFTRPWGGHMVSQNNPCLSEPCQHSGTCQIYLGESGKNIIFRCICSVMHTGLYCESTLTIEEWLANEGLIFDAYQLYCLQNSPDIEDHLYGMHTLEKYTLPVRKGRNTKPKNPCMFKAKCIPRIHRGKFDYFCKCASGTHGKNCSSGCPHGTYGSSCKRKCGWCINNRCDYKSGRCKLPGCRPGFDSSSKTCTVQKGVAVSLTTTLTGRYDASLKNPASPQFKHLYGSFDKWMMSTCRRNLNFSTGCTFYSIKFEPGSVRAEYTVLLDEPATNVNVSQRLAAALEQNIEMFSSDEEYFVDRKSVKVFEVSHPRGLQTGRGSSVLRSSRTVAVVAVLAVVYLLFIMGVLLKYKRRKTYSWKTFA